MIAYNNPLTQQVFLVLKPLTGEFMAQSILKTKFNALGINQDSLKTSDLSKLAEEIRKGLSTFLGNDVANQVSAKIKTLK